jgi:D-alanyl-D-alanine carboxypeptidase
MRKGLSGLALALLLGTSPAQAQRFTVEGAFEDWLAAVNSGDEAAIRAWYDRHLGIDNPAFALDMAEDTCGFDLVRVESQTAEAMTVLLAEKCFPAFQRVTIEVGSPSDEKLKDFSQTMLALPLRAANSAVAAMADRLAAQDRFAGSVLIARSGEPVLARSWGRLDQAGSDPISLDTPMFLASAGKMFTAVSILQLVEEGRIELDAPFGRYLTDYPNKDMARATIRHLLQHRGGTGDIGVLARDEGANRQRARTIEELLRLNGDRGPAFEPGSATAYSNYGFLLLGAVVERVTGKSYYDHVAERIFRPAGMSQAGFPDLDNLDGVATGYTTFYGEERDLMSHRDTLPWRGTPAGGGVASAQDMLKFLDALRSGTLLSPAMLEVATTGDTSGWGLGFVANTGEYASFGHGGGSYGMDVAAHHYPGIDTTIICLASRDSMCNRLMVAWFLRVFGPSR